MQPRAARIQAPDQGHPVGNKQIEPTRNFAEVRIVPPQGDDVRIR